ncbi:hypothetical protein ROZALSC1DRAFT_28673 [Rozella allomycis CSF55]|uniref:Uncharacterized protein n=1 Tax=Rozella allomycis (strain CSF55) TaxID=988480 RepID=A0A4P9YK12_ROZAC|nr:hypothetical protein ROZALSC1DRAFT_28673 [Rozella allomycis CSF55]
MVQLGSIFFALLVTYHVYSMNVYIRSYLRDPYSSYYKTANLEISKIVQSISPSKTCNNNIVYPSDKTSKMESVGTMNDLTVNHHARLWHNVFKLEITKDTIIKETIPFLKYYNKDIDMAVIIFDEEDFEKIDIDVIYQQLAPIIKIVMIIAFESKTNMIQLRYNEMEDTNSDLKEPSLNDFLLHLKKSSNYTMVFSSSEELMESNSIYSINICVSDAPFPTRLQMNVNKDFIKKSMSNIYVMNSIKDISSSIGTNKFKGPIEFKPMKSAFMTLEEYSQPDGLYSKFNKLMYGESIRKENLDCSKFAIGEKEIILKDVNEDQIIADSDLTSPESENDDCDLEMPEPETETAPDTGKISVIEATEQMKEKEIENEIQGHIQNIKDTEIMTEHANVNVDESNERDFTIEMFVYISVGVLSCMAILGIAYRKYLQRNGK